MTRCLEIGNIENLKCCCSISYKVAAQIFAAFFITADILAIIGLTSGFMFYEIENPYMLTSTMSFEYKAEILKKYFSEGQMLIGYFILALLLIGLDTAMNISLWTGVQKIHMKKCRRWLTYSYIILILMLISFIVELISLKVNVSFILSFFNILFRGYAVVIVRSLLVDIRDNPTEYLRPLVPE